MRTILVCGSRDWPDELSILCALSWYCKEKICVMHGNAPGADLMADRVARSFGYDVLACPADWKMYGKRAGILRNLSMLDAEPERVIAFQRNGSPGTQHTITEAHRRGIPVELHTIIDDVAA